MINILTTLSILAHAAYFGVYEKMKSLVRVDREGHHPVRAAISGASAAFAHDLFMTPLDTVKQRMQLGYYKNTLHCINSIIRQEGIRSLYLSLPTTIVMNLPYGCIMVATNESVKKILNPSEKYNFMVSMISGSIAGTVAAACTNPLDVIKTRLQTQSLKPCPMTSTSILTDTNHRSHFINSQSPPTPVNTTPNRYVSSQTQPTPSYGSLQKKFHTQSIFYKNFPSVFQTMRNYPSQVASLSTKVDASNVTWTTISTIMKEDGYAGFMRGVVPRMVVHAPSVAISWTVYEGIKNMYLSPSIS